MSYSYNRLVKKYMPNSSGTDLYDVDYIYGSYNDGRNGVGRIVSITQGGGFKSDSYRYDELGQRVEEDITVDVPMYGYRDFNTKKYFDSFGRILQAVYPDGDQVDYDYNSLGELNTIKSKVAGVTQDIVSAISYNGYGQISQLTYGNGTTTSYSYATGNTNKATTLMGSTVNAKEQGASVFTPVLSRTYTYNKQGMVAQMNRNVAGSLLSQVGNASFTDAYTYDRFGRLDAHAQSKGGTSIYSLDMQYNQAGGITFKTSNGSGFMNASALNYDLLYSYSGNYGHQLERIDDPVNASTTYFTYNTSGSITQIDDPSQAIAQNFFWNEQQQLTGVSNQQGVHHYVYDHSGERIMKSSLINSTVYLNDQVIDDVSNLEPYTVYVNPYYVVTGLMGGDRVSKHYYMNQQRVATDITINYDPNGTGGGQQEQASAKDPASAAPELSPALTNFNEVLIGLGQKPLDTASLKLPTIASYYPEAAKTPATSSSAEGNPSAPRILFWYHPDYLGNVDLITERDGYTHEFFMYNPWGEEMHQWNANTYAFTSPYRFNAKELDPETGLAYYGARYYQNKIGVWLSVDPLAHVAPGWSPYRAFYCNPIQYTDPDGQWEWDATGNLVAQKGDNSYTMAKFLGTSQSNAMQILNRSGVTANAKGVLNLKVGQSFAKENLWVGTKSASGPVVNNTKEATAHYYTGNGAAADVGDQSTRELLSSDKFQAKHNKITSEQVQAKGDFSVNMTGSTFHIGNTGVDYSVTNNGTSSAVKYTLFARDGFWDPDFIDENTLGKIPVIRDLTNTKSDGSGPALERGGTPYHYKTRERTFFFKPVEENK